MIFTDYPIEKKDKDKLGRYPISKHVAKLINELAGSESFVIGVEGEWGSGKTSFINLVKAGIDPKKVEIISFNPWNFSSQNELIKDFFILLSNKLESIGQVLLGYADQLFDSVNFKLAPKITLKDPATGVEVGGEFGEISKEKNKEEDLATKRKKIEKALAKHDKKLLIVIDDIDRLHVEEILAIFKLVKVTANFPNCIFLLSYSRKYVIKQIDTVTEDSGEDYLKKIIQVTFRLPEMTQEQIKKMLFVEIEQTVSDFYGGVNLSDDDKVRWSSIVSSGFPNLFLNIRDIKRYTSSLRLNLQIIGKDEVNIIDFITLEAIRVFAPDFYDEIARNKWLFIQGSYGLIFQEPGTKKEDVFKELTNLHLKDKHSKKIITEVTKDLFPQFGFGGSHSEEEWRRNKRVCVEAKFDNYFQLSVTSDEISEGEFNKLIPSLSGKKVSEIKVTLSRLNSKNKLRNFLSKVHDHFDNIYTADSQFIENLALALASSFQDFDKQEPELFDTTTILKQYQRLVWRISERLSEKNLKAFLTQVLSKTKHFYQKVDLLEVFEREKVGKQKTLGQIHKVVAELKLTVLPNMQNLIKKDLLKKEVGAGQLLWVYTRWGMTEEAKAYITKLVSNKKDVLVVLDWFKVRGSSSVRGDYFAISKGSLKNLVDLSLVDKTVASINYKTETKEIKALIDLYNYKDPFFE